MGCRGVEPSLRELLEKGRRREGRGLRAAAAACRQQRCCRRKGSRQVEEMVSRGPQTRLEPGAVR